VRALVADLRAAGAPVALGLAFQSGVEAASGIGDMEEAAEAHEEAVRIVMVAGYALSRRRLLRHADNRFELRPGSEEILRYYARSIGHHVGWSDIGAP
jgi:hypothetical protein